MKILTRVQIFAFFVGLNLVFWFFLFTMISRIVIDAISAITPPNFDGIDRRIAYANKKYHSG